MTYVLRVICWVVLWTVLVPPVIVCMIPALPFVLMIEFVETGTIDWKEKMNIVSLVPFPKKAT